jgi:hypothetical protein
MAYVSKNIKIIIYKTIILPVVLYGCETWSLTLREEHRLRVTHFYSRPSLMQLCSFGLCDLRHPVHWISQCFSNVTNYAH